MSEKIKNSNMLTTLLSGVAAKKNKCYVSPVNIIHRDEHLSTVHQRGAL